MRDPKAVNSLKMTVLSVVGLFLLIVSTAVTNNVVELSDATPPVILDKIDKPAGYIRSCRETSYTGKVIVKLNSSRLFETACIQGHRLFGDGWMVMQQHLGSAEILMKSWEKYRGGFGSVDWSFWAGLENIYQLTKTTPHELVVEFVKYGGEYSFGRYERFEIDSEYEKYAIKVLGRYNGSATEFLNVNKGYGFSTFDVDNSPNLIKSCALSSYGAWWYNKSCKNHVNNGDHIYTRMMVRDIEA